MQEREFIFGWDQKFSKRSSGLFSVLKWFSNKDSVSVPSPGLVHSASSSCDSIVSDFSTDTVASFAFVPPNSYKPFGSALQAEKFILPGPETSTYRARLAQREERIETDRNLTLRSKYNLHKDTEPDRGHSLPLMSTSSITEQQGMHRRSSSESSRLRRAGAYCHVKGKRKAPQPPEIKGENTLRRKKRLAPQPPNIICNDSLKLDHGILKPAKEKLEKTSIKSDQSQEMIQVSPRPWYKRTLSKSIPEKKSEQEKRKSVLSFLTNISELDREAMEIVGKENLKMKYLKPANQAPAFMRPKGNEHVRNNSDSWILPNRKSARDLIAKFNAITSVTRDTVPLDSKEFIKEESISVEDEKDDPVSIDQDVHSCNSPSEKLTRCTADSKPVSRSQWNCSKCSIENDYWRIICKVCSTIKPYFDDFTSITATPAVLDETKINMSAGNVGKNSTFGLFNTENVECRVPNPQRLLLLSQYPELTQNFNSHLTKNCIQTCLLNVEKQNTSDEANKLENKSEVSELSKSNMQISIQSKYPPDDLYSDLENKLETVEISHKILTENNISANNIVANNSNLNNVDMKEKTNLKTYHNTKIEKIILGDELAFSKPSYRNANLENSSKVNCEVEKIILGDAIDVKQPNYANITHEDIYSDEISLTSQCKTQNEEKIMLDDAKGVKYPHSSKKVKASHDNDSSELLEVKRNADDKEFNAKKSEHEKLKKMLIEMKNSLPKIKLCAPHNNENKRRVSLIKELSEPEVETEIEKSAVIVVTTETVYENIKVKFNNADKPVKVSSSAQTNAALRRNISPKEISTIQNSDSFHLIKAKDFVGISKEKTEILDDNHTYINLNKAECSKTDTMEINRLSRRLETAIAGGEPGHAAVFARELAQLKVPLSVIRQKSEEAEKFKDNVSSFNVDMYVEDKISHRGPFSLTVTSQMTVADLKKLVEEKYKFPTTVQRWILGKQLAIDDHASLFSHQILNSGCPIFLYLVAPANEPKCEPASVEIVEINDNEPPRAQPSNIAYHVPVAIIEEDDDGNDKAEALEAVDTVHNVQELWKCNACTLLNPVINNKCEVCGLIRGEVTVSSLAKNQTYIQLMNLDNEELVRNTDKFECLVCFAECPPGEGVTLRECLHQFCRTCLAQTVEFSEEAEVKCPYRDEQYSCDIALQDREVKALVSSAVYEQHLAKSVKQAENKMNNTFHCKTPDCTGWCIYEDNVNDFHCPVCRKNNCLTCQAFHSGMNCKQYQEKMKSQSETDEEARRTRNFLEDMITRGEALSCPTCQVVLLKKWGCDWLRCSMCKTEICWVTRGPRWGLGGKGDTSAGCKCGVNGIKCHPKCNYCH